MSTQLKEVELEQNALTVSGEARLIVVVDQITYNQAAEKLLGVRSLIKQIDETFDPDINRWHQGHKAAIATKKKVLGDLPVADSTLVRSLGEWEMKQRRIREENDRREQAEARKREEDARLALALEAEQHGAEVETVQEILNTPQPIMVPPSKPTFQRAEGMSARSKPLYRWKIINEKIIPGEYKKVDEVKINGVVRAMGPAAERSIPGIEVYEDVPTIAVRTAGRL